MGSVRLGKLHLVPVVSSGDEIERFGNSFNEMLRDLERFREQVGENQELQEERIRQRTQTLADPLVRAESANRAKERALRADLQDVPELFFLLTDELERLRRYAEPARQGIRTVA